MSSPSTIKCPNCKHEFQLGEAISSEIEASIKARYMDRFNKDQKLIAEKEKEFELKIEQLKKQEENQEQIIADKIKLSKSNIGARSNKKSRFGNAHANGIAK